MFYDNVRDLCAVNRTNITQLAKDLGLSTSITTKWKNGAIPKADTLKKIADHFGVSTDFLLSDNIRNTISLGDISNSAVVHGNSGSSVSISYGSESRVQDETEKELLRIYRSLGTRGKTAVMTCLYEQEEKQGGVT